MGETEHAGRSTNLPAGITMSWPWVGYAGFGGQDWSTAYVERGEIYDFVREHGITGFTTLAGDRPAASALRNALVCWSISTGTWRGNQAMARRLKKFKLDTEPCVQDMFPFCHDCAKFASDTARNHRPESDVFRI
jgi:hypothetical protein